MLGSSTENSRCCQPAPSVNEAGAGVHLLLTVPPATPPVSPQQVPDACGRRAPFSAAKLPISPFTRLPALPILFRFSEASVVLLRFIYSRNAGIARSEG